MIPDSHLQVLKKIVTRLSGSRIQWALTGSLGMALQGLSLEVHDIDIQTDRDGAYEIERLLNDSVVQPVRWLESERMRSHLGKFLVAGVEVEVMGDIQKRLDDHTWEEPVRIEAHRRWLDVDGLAVPVLSLEYEYQAYLQMGRIEKARLLQTWLQTHGQSQFRK